MTTTDDEDLPVATLVLTPASISEAGGLSTVTATLSGKSSAAVTLTVGTTAVSPAVQTDFTRTGSTLTIAAGATTSAGTVTVAAVDNSAAQGSKRVTVSATAAGGNGVADPSDATLTLRDDEFSLAESAVSGQATEGGGQATFTVALRSPPSQAVTVAVSSQDTGEGLVSAGGGAPAATTTLTFTPGAWSTAQTVTVTGVDDDVDDGTVTWSVRLDPSSGDATFDGLANVDVVVTTTDDDTAGVEASPSAGLVTTEGGGEATFTVRLASEPLGTVVLDVASDDTGEGTVDTDAQAGAQSTLTFTAGDWSSAQTVTVAGVDDTETDGDQGYTVTLAVNQTATADATYDALGTVSVSVVNRDDEVTADVNGDGAVNANDGLLMYYAYTFEAVFKLENDLGRRVRGFLRTLRGAGSPAADDAGYKAMLDNAWGWRSADSAAGDVNGDGSISANDGLLMYYALHLRGGVQARERPGPEGARVPAHPARRGQPRRRRRRLQGHAQRRLGAAGPVLLTPPRAHPPAPGLAGPPAAPCAQQSSSDDPGPARQARFSSDSPPPFRLMSRWTRLPASVPGCRKAPPAPCRHRSVQRPSGRPAHGAPETPARHPERPGPGDAGQGRGGGVDHRSARSL